MPGDEMEDDYDLSLKDIKKKSIQELEDDDEEDNEEEIEETFLPVKELLRKFRRKIKGGK